MNVLIRNLLRNSLNLKLLTIPVHKTTTAAAALIQNITINQQFHAYYSTTATLGKTSSNDGIFKKMIKKLQNSKSRLRGGSILLYENIADGVNYVDFFKEFQLKDTFNSWFLITELHVWLLLTRVMREGSTSDEDGRFMRNCIVEAMWTDVQFRSKKLGSDNPSFTRKQISILSEQFQATLISYDEGLCFDDKTLANALWRRFFEAKCEDFTKLEKLVIYVRKSSNDLDRLTREQLLSDPKIQWTSIRSLTH